MAFAGCSGSSTTSQLPADRSATSDSAMAAARETMTTSNRRRTSHELLWNRYPCESASHDRERVSNLPFDTGCDEPCVQNVAECPRQHEAARLVEFDVAHQVDARPGGHTEGNEQQAVEAVVRDRLEK